MKKRILTFLILCLMTSMLAACSSSSKEPEKKSYTVTFDLNGGTLVYGETEQTVEEGESATPPKVENGHYSLDWSGNYSNITSNSVVTAEWTLEEMSSSEVASYVLPAVVTVNADDLYGYSNRGSTGTGFFIDDEGTILTCYHVIEGANELSVTVSDGANYNVKKIVGFSPLYDIAILKIDYSSDDYLNINTDSVSLGEQVYAIGSSLGELEGSFTSGTLSSLNRSFGEIECYQMDAAISSGNSGGPLVDSFGNAIGICAYSYTSGQNNNLAIKLSQLDSIDQTKNYSVNQYVEWLDKETARSYSPRNSDDEYYYSIINRYDVVNSNCACLCSVYEVDGEIQYEEGYEDCCEAYIYDYDSSEYDKYVDYLTSMGFEYDSSSSEENDYYYTNVFMNITLDLFINTNNQEIMIFPAKD